MNVDVYWSHSFLSDLIRPDGIVFDFGVNNGGFSRVVAPKCRTVIGFEPDPSWKGNLSLPPNVRVLPKALAARAGVMTLNINSRLCSSLHYAETDASTVEVEAVTLEMALAEESSGRIDLIKMDIEGEEVPVLLEAEPVLFERVVQMTVEFHDFLDVSSIPAICRVISRMQGLGFHAFRFSPKNYGDMMFVNRRFVSLSVCQRAWLICRFKYARGIGRMIGRWVNK